MPPAMADPYIDHYETIAYGRFAVAQIHALILGLDPELDDAVKIVTARLEKATDAMEAVLKKAADVENVTYTSQTDVVDDGRDTLRRLIKYVESRRGGDAIAMDLLNGDLLTTVIRRRPVKLAAALEHAEKALEKYKTTLAEYGTWASDLRIARAALGALNEGVRKARADRRQMTPEVASARETWLARYSAAKSVVHAILRPLDKSDMMPDVFDDLAELHKAPGVSDDDPSPPETPKQPR